MDDLINGLKTLRIPAIATAIGLFAAIPAVIAYNRFSHQVEKLENSYGNFMEEFSAILHRQAVAAQAQQQA